MTASAACRTTAMICAKQYNYLLAKLAQSELLSNLVSQITGRWIHVQKLDPQLHRDVYQANYALS